MTPVRSSWIDCNENRRSFGKITRLYCSEVGLTHDHDQQQGEIVFHSLGMNRWFSNPVSYILMFGLVQIVGCAPAGPPPTAKVSGKVTRQGQPVTVGQIWFNAPEKGFSANAPLNAEGKYEITENLPPANYKVYFTPPRLTAPPKPGEAPAATGDFKLPDKYQTEQMSGLTADVKAGTQTIDFPLPD